MGVCGSRMDRSLSPSGMSTLKIRGRGGVWVHAHWHGALSSRADITFGNKAERWKKVLARPLSSCIPLETLECVCIFMCVCGVPHAGEGIISSWGDGGARSVVRRGAQGPVDHLMAQRWR